ncbi:MAG: chromosomal replication initiator protein DnaA [Muribaculaceae bacterium]|nr:chromosomal replication initiator protein DnaA [Muribaculaceae bacterium]
MDQSAHQELWARCSQFICDNIEPEQYDTLFRDIQLEKYVVASDASPAYLILQVSSNFIIDEIERRYQSLFRAGIKKIFGEGVQVYYRTLTVQTDPSSSVLQKSTSPSATIMAQSKVESANPFKAPSDRDFDPQLNPRYNFENYCLSESNKIARSIGEAIGDNPSLKTFNPLFVFGPSGVGKTHLIQAIGIRVKERNPQARVLYVTARLFESQYTAAQWKDNINNFFHFYQSIDTLIIDDIQDLQGKPGTQNIFFHIFNHLHQHDRQIILSSDCAPAEMERFEARLLSRFKWGMQVELGRPDIDLRRDVLRQKAEQNGVVLPEDVLEYIAANVTENVRELEGIVTSLLAHATVMNREISVDLARRVMSNAVKIQRRQVNFEMVTEAVASHFKITPDLLFTKTRKREIADARHVVMYLAKKLVKMPLTTIGQRLDRTHATVIHGVQCVEDRLAREKQFAADVETIETSIAIPKA